MAGKMQQNLKRKKKSENSENQNKPTEQKVLYNSIYYI